MVRHERCPARSASGLTAQWCGKRCTLEGGMKNLCSAGQLIHRCSIRDSIPPADALMSTTMGLMTAFAMLRTLSE